MFKRGLLIAGSGDADFTGQAEDNAFMLGLSTDVGELGQGNFTATKK